MTTVRDLLAAKTDADSLARHLDALSPFAREREVLCLSGREQAQLFELGADRPPIRLSHFVPPDVAPRTAVHHAGLNTIPVPDHFKRFQKRFQKPTPRATEICGYNASNAWFITPGYFVAYETDHDPAWRARGGVVIDYHHVPREGVPQPEGWPRVVPNTVGLQKLVYHLTRDFMRGVSEHVSIGRASKHDAKGDQLLDFWFVLVRRDPA